MCCSLFPRKWISVEEVFEFLCSTSQIDPILWWTLLIYLRRLSAKFGGVSRSLVSRKCGRPNVLLFISKKRDFCRRSIRIFVFYSSDGSNIPGVSSNTYIEGICGVLLMEMGFKGSDGSVSLYWWIWVKFSVLRNKFISALVDRIWPNPLVNNSDIPCRRPCTWLEDLRRSGR